MKITEIINRLEGIRKLYGDIDVVCYDNSSNNIDLADGTIDNITVFFNDEKGEDYVEIGFYYELEAHTKSKNNKHN